MSVEKENWSKQQVYRQAKLKTFMAVFEDGTNPNHTESHALNWE